MDLEELCRTLVSSLSTVKSGLSDIQAECKRQTELLTKLTGGKPVEIAAIAAEEKEIEDAK